MAEVVVRKTMPSEYRIYPVSDVHLGAKACHVPEFQRWVSRVESDEHGFWACNGDIIEGKPTRSKHFDPNSLDPELQTIDAQLRLAKKLLAPIADKDKCLFWGKGNHDVYLEPDVDVIAWAAHDLGVPLGGYQTYLVTGKLHGAWWHGSPSMPRGAKDPIQKPANQCAWLADRLWSLGYAGAHYGIMSHVHALHYQPPIEKYVLMYVDGELRARHLVEPPSRFRDEKTGKWVHFVPKDSMHYLISGTFRRSGGPGYTDYAEVKGYPPSPIGYHVIHVKDHAIDHVETVVP